MKRSFNFFLLLGFVVFSTSCNIDTVIDRITDSETSENAILFEQEYFPISPIKMVNVSTSGGSISVIGSADHDAVVEMYVKSNRWGNYSEEKIQEILDSDYDIYIEQRGDVLHAHAERKGNFNLNSSLIISFKIRTQNNINTELSTSGGSIQLANLSGVQNFKTGGGSLSIDSLEGNITGKTSGGSIKAYQSKGVIHLKTNGGSISLEDLDGEVTVATSGGSIKGTQINGSLDVRTSGGSINLDNLACKVKAATSGGKVSAEIRKLMGPVQLSSSGGSVHLTLPENSAVDLNLKGSKINASTLSNFSGSNSKGKLVGRINGGGTSVVASTSGGSVSLSFK